MLVMDTGVNVINSVKENEMDISWTWLGIVVLALIIFACASGFRRGFVKEIVSAFL